MRLVQRLDVRVSVCIRRRFAWVIGLFVIVELYADQIGFKGTGDGGVRASLGTGMHGFVGCERLPVRFAMTGAGEEVIEELSSCHNVEERG